MPRNTGGVPTEVQRLSTDAIVQLFTLDTTPIGGTDIFNWFPGALNGASVAFGGTVYAPFPIECEGFEWRGRGPLPRPRLRASNIGNVLGSVLIGYQLSIGVPDLVGARVTRTVTFQRFLDGQPNADSTSRFLDEIWRIERKTAHDELMIEWELSSPFDQEGRLLPGRQCLRDVCTHAYRVWNPTTGAFDYSKATCPYTGGNYFTQDGNQTFDPTKDRCGKYLTHCRLRFPNSPLPTRAMPGMARSRTA